MAYKYTHRLIYLSVLIREVSTCRSWNQHRAPQLVKARRIRDSGMLSSKWDIYHTPFFLRLRDHWGGGVERL